VAVRRSGVDGAASGLDGRAAAVEDRGVASRADILRRRDAILAAARRHGASDVRLFGSVARGDADDASDVDFLVRFEPGRSLLDQGGLLMELRALLGVEVDVVSEGALAGRFGHAVRREAVPL